MDNPLPPIRLLKKSAPNDVRTAIKKLDRESDQDEILGSVHIVLYIDRHFDFLLTGELHRNPLFTRSPVAELDDELSVLTK
jgi:hypothetical protein